MSKFAASFFLREGTFALFVALVAKTVKNKDFMTELMKIQGSCEFIIEVLEINAIRTENDHHASFFRLLEYMRCPKKRAGNSYHASVSIAILKISVLIGLIGGHLRQHLTKTLSPLTVFLPHKSNIEKNSFESKNLPQCDSYGDGMNEMTRKTMAFHMRQSSKKKR